LSWIEPMSCVVESALAMGFVRTAAVIHRAWRSGCRFDAWAEHFRFDRWREAFAAEGQDVHAAAERTIPLEEPLPWDHISTGVTKRFLAEEHRRALRAELSPDCRGDRCLACGIRQSYGGC
jgi:hypothetical protein